MFIFDHPLLLGFLLGIVLAFVLDVGRQVAVRYKIDQSPERKEQMRTIRDGFFVLLSLLLGFTLTFAASRFAERRSLAVEEAVSIGTTYLRASTLPQPYRDHSRQLLREYIDARLALDDPDRPQFNEAMSRSNHIQEELWLDAATVAQNDRSAITAVYLNSLNETIDLDAKRVAAFEYHVAPAIWILIIFVSLVGGFARGATMTSRLWLSLILMPITIAIAVALIADLDTPTHGLIRLDQRSLQRLKAEIGAAHYLSTFPRENPGVVRNFRPVGTCNSWANPGYVVSVGATHPRQDNIEGERGEFSICRYAGQN